jgi:hypothetical protein
VEIDVTNELLTGLPQNLRYMLTHKYMLTRKLLLGEFHARWSGKARGQTAKDGSGDATLADGPCDGFSEILR